MCLTDEEAYAQEELKEEAEGVAKDSEEDQNQGVFSFFFSFPFWFLFQCTRDNAKF